MITLITTILSFILVFAIVVFVHEFGHFWVARRMGVRVLRFSLGFGPILWKRVDRHGTEFALAAIPLGGYVKMLDGREQTLKEEEIPYAFDHKSVGKRFAIVLAGPLFNFIFAILAFAVVMMAGVQKIIPIVAHVTEHSIAEQVGIQAGDEIVSVDGHQTRDWQSVYLSLMQRVGEQGTVPVQVRGFPDQPIRDYALPLDVLQEKKKIEPDPLAAWGITLGLPHIPPILGEVLPNSPAEKAGLIKDDNVIQIDDKPIHDWYQLVEIVRASPDKALLFTVQRKNEIVQKSVTPNMEEINGVKVGMIGIHLSPSAWPAEFARVHRENPLTALYSGVKNTWELSVLTFDIMGKMLRGLVGLENLAGPISIAQGAQQSVESGWMSFVTFLILLSVNLGVINLLPIPMLDGGHLLYYVLEFLRGKPVSENVQRVGLVIGLVLVLSLMLVGLHNDIIGLRK